MATATEASSIPRLKNRYREEIVPELRSEFAFANIMQVPTVTKVVVNKRETFFGKTFLTDIRDL